MLNFKTLVLLAEHYPTGLSNWTSNKSEQTVLLCRSFSQLFPGDRPRQFVESPHCLLHLLFHNLQIGFHSKFNWTFFLPPFSSFSLQLHCSQQFARSGLLCVPLSLPHHVPTTLQHAFFLSIITIITFTTSRGEIYRRSSFFPSREQPYL